LTGRPPFKAATALDTLLQVIADEPVSPRSLNAQVPRDVEVVCLKCMHKEPRKRYQTAVELADDLGRFQRGEPILAKPLGRIERTIKWVRRSPAVTAMAIGVVLALAVASGVGAWLWQRDEAARKQQQEWARAEEEARQVKVEYYGGFAKRRGVPEGVGRLAEQEARRRNVSYKIYSRGGRVERLDAVNGQGQIKPFPQGMLTDQFSSLRAPDEDQEPCRYEYRRDDQGQLVQEVAFNRAGEVSWVLHFPTANTAYFADRKGFPRSRSGSGLAYVEFTWTEEGFEKEVHYLDRNGNRRPDQQASFGRRNEVDARGLPVKVVFLNATDQPDLTASGYAQVVLSYDKAGNYRADIVAFATPMTTTATGPPPPTSISTTSPRCTGEEFPRSVMITTITAITSK
jgi:hypothetical protein